MDNHCESTENKYNVCIMGASLETGNRGVSALAASLIKIITEVKQNARIFLLIGHHTPKVRYLEVSGRKIEIKVINYRLSPRSKPSEFKNVLV